MTQRPHLLFVYNADSGPVNALKDLWHKTVSPETYDCQLCALTYGPLGMRREWRDFVRGLGAEVRFLHRDELREQFGLSSAELPAVYEVSGGDSGAAPRLWLEASALRAAEDLPSLMALVQARRERGEREQEQAERPTV